ncbi:VWA domain-containing protein [Aliiglaciecola sp. LCG003]|uniref:vWA domain-containing protein n=1 Tax=Aliiglaciecola sp. LCG003 TaxID=3053655 RepID=UPI0025742D75|nr:VWA domain-containing protein [Aliiglaciecola sp. LCG003]WJG10627.1 VWA domain-containing protein [Aliiglaciecola sp. LCG003]
MFEFAWWWVLLALPLPLLVLLLPRKPRHSGAALRVPSLTADMQTTNQKTGPNKVLLVLAIVAWCSLVIASARPQWLGDPVSIPTQGRDLMLAVDLSGSMNQEDMEINGRRVNRLVMIKKVLGDFIARRVGDRLGLILFADTAYLQAPLTYDRATVEQLLKESQIGLVGEQTAIGDAIGLSIKRFQTKSESNKVVILLTDGQNTAGNITPQQANELAINDGVTVYTIGVGADSMITQGFFGLRTQNPSRELDEDMLTELAESTGGQYFRAKDTQALQQIYSILDALEPIERESRQMRPLQALYYYPLALALFLSALIASAPILNWAAQMFNRKSS